MQRKNLMNEVPEEYEEQLKDFIDEVESRVNDIIYLLEIKSVSDLAQIEDALTVAKELSSDLY